MAFAGSASPASLSVVVDVSGRQFNLQDVCVVHVSMWTGDLRTSTCTAAWLEWHHLHQCFICMSQNSNDLKDTLMEIAVTRKAIGGR